MTRSQTFLTAGLLVLAAVLANLGFIALGSIFDYPQVLGRPAAEILEAFTANQAAISLWFVVLAVGAALFAPVAILVGRRSHAPLMRVAAVVGIAAAIVQVVGLSRWPILVPGIAERYLAGDAVARAAAAADFTTIHRVLGTIVGETLGYGFTAMWTILVLAVLGRSLAGRWFMALGVTSAVMIATGVLIPLGFDAFDLVNFIGYVLWSAWLVAFAIVLVRSVRRPAARVATARAVAA